MLSHTVERRETRAIAGHSTASAASTRLQEGADMRCVDVSGRILAVGRVVCGMRRNPHQAPARSQASKPAEVLPRTALVCGQFATRQLQADAAETLRTEAVPQ